jgi:hypothetical protein
MAQLNIESAHKTTTLCKFTRSRIADGPRSASLGRTLDRRRERRSLGLRAILQRAPGRLDLRAMLLKLALLLVVLLLPALAGAEVGRVVSDPFDYEVRKQELPKPDKSRPGKVVRFFQKLYPWVGGREIQRPLEPVDHTSRVITTEKGFTVGFQLKF